MLGPVLFIWFIGNGIWYYFPLFGLQNGVVYVDRQNGSGSEQSFRLVWLKSEKYVLRRL
jgi:hypothetical protein